MHLPSTKMLAQYWVEVLSTALNSLVASLTSLKIWSTKSAKKRHLCASISAHSLHCIYSRQTYNSRIVSQTMVVARGAENILPTAWRRRRRQRQPQQRSERHDRRLASQISYDRCSITIATAAFVPWKKNQSTHPFSLPVCRFASQTCYYIHTIVPPVIQ